MRLLKLVFGACFIVVLLLFVGSFSANSTPSTAQQPTATGSNPAAPKSSTLPQPTPVSSASEPTSDPPPPPVDLNDSDALDKKYGIEAMSHCGVEADDYLKSVTKYEFKWEDTGWLEQKFDKYMKDVPEPGVLVMVSNKAMLQNGFGAYERVELQCAYDIQAKTTAFTIAQ
jgi:hypothetical protein